MLDISVAKKDLLKLVGRMQAVADRKSTMPVLQNVLFAVDGPQAVRLAATDMYLGLIGKVSAEVKKGGTVAIPTKDLFERVKMMPEGPISITTQDNAQTVLKASGSARRYTLRGVPGEEFPPIPQPQDGAVKYAVGVDVLQELIAKTYFSISSDETRAHLNSALFEWDGEIVRMVTTDGHRLSKMEVRVPGRQASTSMLIPLKALLELKKLCDEVMSEPRDKDEVPEVAIVESGPSAFFLVGGMTFSVKLVEAKFPPYSQVIPQGSDKVVRAPRAAFADALRAVSLASSERTGGVKLSLSKGTMRITSESPESGDGFDEIPVDYSGANMSIGFNAKYFLDVLGALSDEDVSLGLSGELDPAVLRSTSDPKTNRDFLAVVMPMRI